MVSTLVQTCAACGETHWIDMEVTDESVSGLCEKTGIRVYVVSTTEVKQDLDDEVPQV